MANKKELRELLKRKIDLSIPKVLEARRLDEAADQLIKARHADRPLFEAIAREASGDEHIQINFSNTDIDDVNDILNQINE
jgi:hypothetical protein